MTLHDIGYIVETQPMSARVVNIALLNAKKLPEYFFVISWINADTAVAYR
jgi:hypothetical protein